MQIVGDQDGPQLPHQPVAPHLEGLNARQLEAVETQDGPLLMLAGAGTGKTRALTARIAHLITTGRVRPYQILAVTFTNKAASEMKSRLEGYLGTRSAELNWVGTFHAISGKILRARAELVELKPDFTILDKMDQLRLLGQLVDAETSFDKKDFPVRMLSRIIDNWKNRGWTPEAVPEDREDVYGGRGVSLYKEYQDRLKVLNSVDFGDLLLHTTEIFKSHPRILELYQNRFRFIHVDEYQDTNVAQYLWLRLLAQSHRNICVVGDDDQSIYGWRGAVVQHILDFHKNFHGAKVVRLEQNYRSANHILQAASGLIHHNGARLGKKLWSAAGDGKRVKIDEHFDPEQEAVALGKSIERLRETGIDGNTLDYGDFAVLVRATFLIRTIEERFVKIGMPYRIVGGLRFYERKEVRDAIAYLRFARSFDDGIAFERIVNFPRRGVGTTTLRRIHAYAVGHKVSLAESARRMLASGRLRNPAKRGLQMLLDLRETWAKEFRSGKRPPAELVSVILDESGLSDFYLKERSVEAETRLENLKELISVVKEHGTIQAFLDHVALLTDNSRDTDDQRVSIMTIHAAKGLEFPVVFLPGWEDGLIPSQRTIDENGERGLEEERRLAHVAITRAKLLCSISSSLIRSSYGSDFRETIPSRFISELPSGNIEHLNPLVRRKNNRPGPFGTTATGADDRWSNKDSLKGYKAPNYERMRRNLEARAHSPKTPPGRRNPTVGKGFRTGDRVAHANYGDGTVITASGKTVMVKFDSGESRLILSSFVFPASSG